MIEGRARVYYHFGREPEFDLKLIGWVNRVRAQVRRGARGAARIRRARPPAARSAPVQVARRAAADAQVRARSRPTRTCARCAPRPAGMNEYEVEAELLHEFRRHGAVPALRADRRRRRERLRAALPRQQRAAARRRPAADRRRRRISDCYASDITPHVSGQRPLHAASSARCTTVVLAAQLAAIDEVRPGRPFDACARRRPCACWPKA